MSILIPTLVAVYLFCAVGIYKLALKSVDSLGPEDQGTYESNPGMFKALLVVFSAFWPVGLLIVLTVAAIRR